MPVNQSAVIKPVATLGIVTTGSKVSITRLGTEHFITASVGPAFHIYDCDDLQLQYLSRPLPSQIGAVLGVKDCSIISTNEHIYVFHKMTQLAYLKGHTERIHTLQNLGDSFMVSVSKSEVLVWQLPNVSKQMHPLAEPLSPVRRLKIDFEVTSAISIPTYVNKMLFAGTEGQLELWNINKGERVYEFQSTKHSEKTRINTLASAPVLDVAGIGYSDGTISVINLKSDEIVLNLNQKEHGSVTCMTFRHDSVGGQLVTGTEKGDLVVWDLNKRVIHSFHRGVHPGGAGTVEFLDTLPLMISAGASDNSLLVHIFDLPDQGCRVLKERRGFTADLSFLLPYGEHDLLVGGTCNEWGKSEVGRLNLIQSHQNRVWSQKNLQSQTSGKGSLMPWRFRNMNQLPAIKSISHCPDRLRHFDWPSVVSAHEGLPDAYVWSPHQEALVTRMLMVPRKATTGTSAPCASHVAVSTCGNYAVVGFENGEIHRFNLQSCYHRGLVGEVAPGSLRSLKFISSRDMVSSDTEGIKVWKVVPRASLVSTITCVTDIDNIEIQGFLCAVSHNEEMHVSVVDLHADKRVRKIPVSAKVTAMAWAEGGKWISIATADKRMIIYDIATAMVIDRVEFNSTVIALRFTHRNTQLITSHADGKGAVRVWQNVALLHGPGIVDADFYRIDEPQVERKRGLLETSDSSKKQKTETTNMARDEVVLFGGSKWQQILKLDEIKERNKPKRPAEKPKSAPFFLPIKYQGVQPVFVAPVDDESNTDGLKEEGRSGEKSAEHNGFAALLSKKRWAEVENHLMNLSASGIHICLSELEDDEKALVGFIEYLAVKTASGHNIDLTATLTSLFLKSYGSALKGRATFQPALEQLATAAKKRQERFEYETDQLQCLVKVSAALQLHR